MIQIQRGTPDKIWWVGCKVECECGWQGRFQIQDQSANPFSLTSEAVYWVCPDCGGEISARRHQKEEQ